MSRAGLSAASLERQRVVVRLAGLASGQPVTPQGGSAALDAEAQAQGWARPFAFCSRHLGRAS